MTYLVHIGETALLLLAAYLGGCSIGYATRLALHAAQTRRQLPAIAAPSQAPAPSQPSTRARTSAARLAAAASHEPIFLPHAARHVADRRPAALAEPREGYPSDLRQIKGIGLKLEASLNGMGIFHLDQIAVWTEANVDWVDGQLAFKGRVRREQWVEQAIALSSNGVGAYSMPLQRRNTQ